MIEFNKISSWFNCLIPQFTSLDLLLQSQFPDSQTWSLVTLVQNSWIGHNQVDASDVWFFQRFCNHFYDFLIKSSQLFLEKDWLLFQFVFDYFIWILSLDLKYSNQCHEFTIDFIFCLFFKWYPFQQNKFSNDIKFVSLDKRKVTREKETRSWLKNITGW